MVEPRLQSLPLNLIHLDADTQSREGVSQELVDEYADAWLNAADFPPLDVFCSREGEYYLADGFHRYFAARKVAKSTVLCRIFRGTPREAFLFACTANQSHGLRRTNADKRYMVGRFLNDPEWVKWTDSRIAEQCGVSHTFVSAMRRELETVVNSVASQVKNQPRSGSDGKRYPPERKTIRDDTQNRGRVREVAPSHPIVDVRTRALLSLRQTKRHVLALGLDPRHFAALEAIEKDLLAF